MRLETMHFCGNLSMNYLPHLNFNEFLNLRKVFHGRQSFFIKYIQRPFEAPGNNAI